MKPRKRLNLKRMRRATRVSAGLSGTAEKPRLVMHRTNKYIYAQLIDDAKGHTLAAVSSFGKGSATEKKTKKDQAFLAGEALGKKAAEKGIKIAVFDRRSSRFHGRVKSFAEGVQKGGLKI